MRKFFLLLFFYPSLAAEKQKQIMVYKEEIYHLDLPYIPYNYRDKYELPETFTFQVKFPKLIAVVESRIRNKQSFFTPILVPHCVWNNEDWEEFDSPVWQAIQKDIFSPITKIMLEHGLDPCAYTRPNHPYTTVLEDAASNGSLENVQLLLNACPPEKLQAIASRVLRNFAGHHQIDANKRYHIFKLLLNAGADPNFRCSLGQTALFREICARVSEDVITIRLLLEHGAYAQLRDKQGNRPKSALYRNNLYPIGFNFVKEWAKPIHLCRFLHSRGSSLLQLPYELLLFIAKKCYERYPKIQA